MSVMNRWLEKELFEEVALLKIEPQILQVLSRPMHYGADCYCNHAATPQRSLGRGQRLKTSCHSDISLLLSD